MQRYNFQFTGQRFFRIEKGNLAGQVKDLAYQARTTDFCGARWNRSAVSPLTAWAVLSTAGRSARPSGPRQPRLPSALFRSINILNTRTESGR